ncbi:MAG: endonuclease, partial [Cellulosimicrobium cellulans]
MRNPVVAKAYAEITAAVAVLTGVVNEHGSSGLSAADDPLQGLSEDCLDILAGAAAADAQMAGLKALTAVTYADTAQATAPPDASVQAQEMAVTAEVACALTIGDRAAGSFLAVSHALITTLPLTLAALQEGT